MALLRDFHMSITTYFYFVSERNRKAAEITTASMDFSPYHRGCFSRDGILMRMRIFLYIEIFRVVVTESKYIIPIKFIGLRAYCCSCLIFDRMCVYRTEY